MILNTGSRTDIPGYYSRWFYNRVRAESVMVRNPFNPQQVTRYCLAPDVVDVLVFCTKNPLPMFGCLSLLKPFDTFWFVTITPYGRDIEPYVPDKRGVLESFVRLSGSLGTERVSWRYDPIFISERYSVDFHIKAFGRMARLLRGRTHQCVISFIDLYEKVKRNFPTVRAVTDGEQRILVGAFSEIAGENGLQIHLCNENASLACAHVDADGCMSQNVLERAIGCRLRVPKRKSVRRECSCLLGSDIGAYNSCGHGCVYCYANYDRTSVLRNMAHHDPMSPLLIGNLREGDHVRDADQSSWRDGQMEFFAL